VERTAGIMARQLRGEGTMRSKARGMGVPPQLDVRALLFDTGRLNRRIHPAWLTVAQLSRRWQLGRQTIYQFINAGKLPAWKISTHLYRISLDDVLRFEGRVCTPRRRTPTRPARGVNGRRMGGT
jgi:excisionase family DNA binding protein